MNVNRLAVWLCAVSGFAGLTSLNAQFATLGITGQMRPDRWTFIVDDGSGILPPPDPSYPAAGVTATGDYGESVGFGPDNGDPMQRQILFTGPNTPGGAGGPIRMTASIVLPFTATALAFNYAFETDDTRGWGDNEVVPTHYEKAGYILDGVEYVLTPNGDTAGGMNQIVVDVDASEYFTFFFESLDADFGNATFTLDYIHTAVPEPGEWMALAGVGLIGFAGVRRWRMSQAANH